jgi:hypothetical protein
MASGSNFKKNRGKYSRTSSVEKKIEKLKKPGKTYTKAQLLALKRKAMGKTIAEVKADNEKKMRDRARERNAKFKKNEKLKINKNKNNKTSNNKSVSQKIKEQKEKNKKIIKKKNFLSNIK